MRVPLWLLELVEDQGLKRIGDMRAVVMYRADAV